MKTYIPSFNTETKKEYNKPTETPSTHGNNILFAIGGSIKDGFLHNWDYYINPDDGTLYYIAREGSSCKSGYFGDVSHIKYLMNTTGFSGVLTPAGFKAMYKTYRRRPNT